MSEAFLSSTLSAQEERLRRWRLVLGNSAAEGLDFGLSGIDQRVDQALQALYEADRKGGLGASAPYVARWLGDIRSYFPASVVRVLQKDALERLNLRQMLLEPEFLEAVEPDVHLVSTLIALNSVLPGRTRETARLVVQKVVDELRRRLFDATQQAVTGALDQSGRRLRPRTNEIDWRQTIRLNLKNYQPAYRTVIPERLIGYPRKHHASIPQRDIVLCVDQSGSMASSMVYAGIFGAALASLRAIRTHMLVFDTAVVNLSEYLNDPVELLFSTQLGGGTDIQRALAACQGLIQQPENTILVLISDLYEGSSPAAFVQRAAELVHSGVQVIALLALSDEGRPTYHEENAAALAELDIPTFACTPDRFPDLMAAAIRREDIRPWAA
jgi:Mg-chelatase subunit ChlD